MKQDPIETQKVTGDNIYKVLIYFDKLYASMSDSEKRRFISILVSEIQIFEERQPNGQWLKSITLQLPIIENDMEISLDIESHTETVVLLSKLSKAEQRIEVELELSELDATAAETKATYPEIMAYIEEKFGLKVSSLFIAQVKRKCGLKVDENYNLPAPDVRPQPQVTPEKEAAIREALKHFAMI